MTPPTLLQHLNSTKTSPRCVAAVQHAVVLLILFVLVLMSVSICQSYVSVKRQPSEGMIIEVSGIAFYEPKIR
jgi:hypothetical protein